MRTFYVFSIKTSHANDIYEGRKTAEIRSFLPSNPEIRQGDVILLYESKPVGMITGFMIAGRSQRFHVSDFASCSFISQMACVQKEYLLAKARDGYVGVVWIESFRQLKDPLPIGSAGIAAAPMSWRRLPRFPEEMAEAPELKEYQGASL